MGPAGPRGESGPPGALATTPIAVEYTSTSANSHDVAAIGGMTVRLECGSGRIGESAVDFYVTRADEVHGMVTNTQYDGNTVESATPAAFDSGSAPSGAPASAFVSGTGTHATQQAQLTLLKDGAVYTLTLYTSRDIRQGRPVCEFIGAMTQQGAPTVTPS